MSLSYVFFFLCVLFSIAYLTRYLETFQDIKKCVTNYVLLFSNFSCVTNLFYFCGILKVISFVDDERRNERNEGHKN